MTIHKIEKSGAAAAALLAAELWPDHTAAELEELIVYIMESGSGAVFVAREGAESVGYAQCQLRHDYVEGTDTSPVGYLEGIYVCPAWRGKGTAAALLAACEDWARGMGCTQFASDCELDNAASLNFHLALGFSEVNRIICFAKEL